MASIITLDSLNEESELLPNQANFPAVQHFFKYDESDGSININIKAVDSITGISMAHSITSLSKPGLSFVLADLQIDDTLIGGSWAVPNGKAIVMMVLQAKNTDGIFIMGASAGTPTTDRVRVGSATTDIFEESVGTADAAVSLTNGQDRMHVITADINNSEVNSIDIAENGTITENTPAAIVNTTALTDLGNLFTTTYDELFGVAVFHFNQLPDDVAVAAAWMHREWLAGNKVIYPAWKGKS